MFEHRKTPAEQMEDIIGEKITNGVWVPKIFDQFSNNISAGCSTKLLEKRDEEPKGGVHINLRETASPERFAPSKDEARERLKKEIKNNPRLSEEYKKSALGNIDEVLEERERAKISAGLMLTRMLREFDKSADLRNAVKVRAEFGTNVLKVDENIVEKIKTREGKDEVANMKADALITNIPHIPLLITPADCATAIIYDSDKKALGIAHAGWVGIVKDVCGATIKSMQDNYGTNTENIYVAIAPFIDQDNYEVDKKVYDEFLNSGAFSEEEMGRCFKKSGNKDKFLFDSGKALRISLEKAGIPDGQIFVSQYSTFKNNNLFSSERKEGIEPDARNLNVVMGVLK